MPATHHIDSENMLISTTWSGEASDSEFIEAIMKYQREIRGNPDYLAFNEIVDLSAIAGISLSTEGLKSFGLIATRTDQAEIKTKLALIVRSTLAYGLARMYGTLRSFLPNTNKEVKVFKEVGEARVWLGLEP